VILVFSFADAKEAEKFEYLYGKYKKLLYYKAWEILRDPMAAEDALSETMIRVYRNMAKIGDPDSPESAAFLTTIVRNVSLTLRKRQASAPEPVAVGGADEDGPENEPADIYDLEALVIDGLTEERLCIIIGKLDEESRNIFVLKYAYDLSHREIASQLGLTENNVTVRLHRTRKKLAAMAEEDRLFAG
jgi:RNA polymerase sigma-70 factor (ECF subfamily)